MNLAEAIANEYGGLDSASYTPPELQAGWSVSTGLQDAAKTVGDLFGSYLGLQSTLNNAKYAQQSQQLDLLNRTAQIDINRTMTGAQVDIAKAQAQAAVNIAQGRAAATNYDLSNVLGNVNARIAGLSSGNSLMLWLTVAGVGIAALQFFKARR